MSELVSIVMPVYNVEKYIERCMRSILAQTYRNFELLVIDDGSEDQSLSVARQFEDPRITIFTKENGGLSDARNFGLSRCSGKYIYFIDSDDWAEPNLLEVAVNTLEQNNSDFVIFGYYQDIENEHSTLYQSRKISSPSRIITKNIDEMRISPKDLNLMGYAWNKVYRSSYLNSNNIKFEKGISLVEDILFNCKVYQHSERIHFIKDILYHYMDRPSVSLIKTYHVNSFKLVIQKHEALIRFLDTWGWDSHERNRILADSLMLGLRYTLNSMKRYGTCLNPAQKTDEVRLMINEPAVRMFVPFYKPDTIKSVLFKVLVQFRLIKIISILFI